MNVLLLLRRHHGTAILPSPAIWVHGPSAALRTCSTFWRPEGGINTHYWSEKLEAGAGCSAREMLAKEYNHDAFCKSLKESLSDYPEDEEGLEPEEDEDWDDDDDVQDSDKARVREIVRELCRAEFNHDFEAYNAVYDADWPERFSAQDICDGLTFKTYTSHFRWILFAITRAISKYHNAKIVDKAMATFLAVKGAQE